MSIDGLTQCVAPTYAPTQYNVCDIGSPSTFKANAWAQCTSELSVPNPNTSESTALAYASCFDKKMVGNSGSVVGPVPWKARGTSYNDGSCNAGTVREVEGHTSWGVGNLTGASSITYTFTKSEPASCPSGHSEVWMNIRGFNELVRCKPVNACGPDEMPDPTRPNVCLKIVEVTSLYKPCATCPGGFRHAGVGNPIYPLTGVKREEIGTGLSLAGDELKLTYDTSPALSNQWRRVLPSVGKLWSSSLHRNLAVGTGAVAVTAHRGNGFAATFTLKNGTYTADGDEVDKLAAISGGYVYTDVRRQEIETYNSQGQLTKLEGVGGKVLTFIYSSVSNGALGPGYLLKVTDQSGRSLRFRYDLVPGSEVNAATRGLVAAVVDSHGRRVSFTYDTDLNLVAITWPNGKSTQYLYETSGLPWAMTGRLDETGTRTGTWDYDSYGRATGTSLAGGVNSYSVAYSSPPEYAVQETIDTTYNLLNRRRSASAPSGLSVTAPNGITSSWSSTAILGTPLLAGTSQASGSGNAASSSAVQYDTNGNVTSSDDYAGVRSCFVYDSQNREIVRVEGLANSVNCSTVTGAGATLPTGSRKFTTNWHPDWRASTSVVAPLRATTTVYQGQPDPTNSNAAANCSSASNLANGKPAPVICKRVQQPTLISDAIDTGTPATVDRFTYNSAGRVTSSVSNQTTTTYAYHSTTDFDAGTSDAQIKKVTLLVHAEGSDGTTWAEDTSLAEQVLVFAGDTKISTTRSKWGASSLLFDGLDDYVWLPPADFNFGTGDFTIEGWFYLSAADSNYHYTFNVTWANGSSQMNVRFGNSGFSNQLQYSINSNTFAGVYATTYTQTSLVGTWHHFAMTRESGVVRAFLDGAQQTVRNNLGSGSPITSWTDTSDIKDVTAVSISNGGDLAWLGNIDEFRVTKGNARYTSNFTAPTGPFVDPDLTLTGQAAGDLSTVTNAAGHVTQLTKFDRAGRVRQSVDPKGLTTDVTYTARGQVSTVTLSGTGVAARTTTYTYNDNDQLVGVQMPDGSTLAYLYDAAHRVVGVTDSRGNSVTYTLDASGNKTGEDFRDQGGTLRRSIARSFDALNRVQQVVGAQQ